VHEKIYSQLTERIVKAFKQIEPRIGDPLDEKTLVGPLHNKEALIKYKSAVAEAIANVGDLMRGMGGGGVYNDNNN
jgi:acyl-CoA reductase-like NAD-dependent aldehyde dehydrogenase